MSDVVLRRLYLSNSRGSVTRAKLGALGTRSFPFFSDLFKVQQVEYQWEPLNISLLKLERIFFGNVVPARPALSETSQFK